MSDAPAGSSAPAPAAPSTPAPEPTSSPLEGAREAAERMWNAEPKAEPAAPPSDEGPPAKAPAADGDAPAPEPEEQPRGPDGKFLPKDAPPAEDGEEGDLDAGEDDDDAPEADAGEPGEGEDDDVEAGEGEDGEAEDGIVVALPGRHPHDPEFEIEVSTEEAAERLRQLKNGYMRGEEARSVQAQVEQEWGQIADVEEHIQIDPIGFIQKQLPAEYAPRLALQILADPAVLKAVEKDLRELITPATHRTKLAELKAEKYETRELLAQARSARKEGATHAMEVRSAVAALIPPEYDAEKAGEFLRNALNDVGSYADRMGLDRIDTAQLPVLLARRLQEAGINPVQAAARLAAGPGRKTSTGGPPKGRPPRASAGKHRAAPGGRPTGADFVKGAARRKAAATTPPGGVGAPKAPVAPPPGTTLKEATAMARARRRS